MSTETRVAYCFLFVFNAVLYIVSWEWMYLVSAVLIVAAFIATHYFVKVWKEEFKREREEKLKP